MDESLWGDFEAKADSLGALLEKQAEALSKFTDGLVSAALESELMNNGDFIRRFFLQHALGWEQGAFRFELLRVSQGASEFPADVDSKALKKTCHSLDEFRTAVAYILQNDSTREMVGRMMAAARSAGVVARSEREAAERQEALMRDRMPGW